jgi:methyl-accepting chemotaxis protein
MKLLSNMKIGNRLALGFAVVLGFSVLLTIVGLLKMNALAGATKAMLALPIEKERLVSDWSRNIDVAVARTTVIAKSSDTTLVQYFAKQTADTSKSAADILKKLEPLLADEKEKQVYAKSQEVRKTFIAGRQAVLKLKEEGKFDEANALLEKTYIPAAESYQRAVSEFLELQREQLDRLGAEVALIEKASRNQFILLALLCAAGGIFSAWWLTRSITRPVTTAVALAQRVADGDLSVQIEVESRDELGQLQQALKNMNNNLNSMVSQIRTGAEAIATASSEIAAGNADLSSRTEQQAGSIEETASSMEELTSTVKQNADNARQANQLAASASEVADKGGVVVSQVVDTMVSINDSSKKIVDIIGVIDGIAFQTNILALNAAVEAARAGEQGRGFAVVASEVRSLAQRSAAAAKEIKALINDSVEKVSNGSQLVTQAGATMDEIVLSIKQVTDIMGEIMEASREQGAGIEQVNQAISQMDQVTQQNAALVEQAAAASDAMQKQGTQLAQVVSVFKLSKLGDNPVALPPSVVSKVPKVNADNRRRITGSRTAVVAKKERRIETRAVANGEWEEF